jgi:Putative MetA-pathway of phenol degradation
MRVLPAALAAACWLVLAASSAHAGPPYLTDDPEPTDYKHFEIYAFGDGVQSRDGMAGETGIDFNYGGAPDLQLTAVIPLAYDEAGHTGLGNIELAAKYRFLHQDADGVDLSIFPRVFLPSVSHIVGDDHTSLLIPLWAEKDYGKWSIFGGGGCTFNKSRDSQNFCAGGVVVTREVLEGLRLGLEVFHQGADTLDGRVSTAVGGGLTYDVNDHYHLLAYWGPGLQNVSETGRANAYLAVLFTF